MTLAELDAEIATVNTAIAQLIAGKRLNELKVGSGTFSRYYVYQAVTLENLTDYRRTLLDLRDTIAVTTPTFKTNCNFPLIVGKEIF